jgi:hypothetical protein
MYVVKNSARAMMVAMLPLATIHGVLTAMALLGIQGTQPTDLPAPDRVLVFYVIQLAVDGALLFAGHRMLRRLRVFSRFAYAAMGGVMAAAGYAIAIRNNLQLSSPGDGVLLTVGLLPTIAGMISGFLYGQFAGLEVAENFPKHTYEGLVTSIGFDGPTRVRTSVAAITIAAVMPAALTTVLSITFASLLPGFAHYMSGGTNPVIAAAIVAQLFLTFLVTSIVPSAIFALCLHHLARAMRRQKTWEYAGIGVAMAVVCTILIAPVVPLLSGFTLLVLMIVCGAMMGALYRSFAGLEPMPLPEAVIATDPNALVGADDPARRQHRVILSN